MAEEKIESGRERDNRPVKREMKQSPGLWKRLRRNRAVAFLFEAYAELRYKVTWPTFKQARSMTIAVILFSAAVSAFLALADAGLLKLFRLVSGGN